MPPIRRFLTCLLILTMTPVPAFAAPGAPFFSPPLPAGSDGATLTSDYSQMLEVLPKVSAKLTSAKAAKRDAPLGRATTDLIIAGMALTTAGLQLDMGHLDRAAETLKVAHHRLRQTQLLMMPSRTAEARGMYLDGSSIPKTKAGIISLLDQLQAARFNLLVPEVFRRGYTAWPSPLSQQDPEFAAANFDVLGFLIDEAHHRGMEVHPWFWVFRVRSPGFGNPVLDQLPGLAASKAGMSEPPRFISPASADGRTYAAAVIRDMRRRYPIDGVLLDYLRYDETLGDDDISVTAFRMQYLNKYGRLPPAELVPGSPPWTEWQLWREQQIHRFVDQLRKDIAVPIGAAVFRGIVGTRLQKMQNWRHWTDNRWTRYTSHMLYTADPRDLDMWLDWETDRDKRRDLLYPILGPIRFRQPDDLYPQLELLRQRQIPGYSLFALLHFDRTMLPDLAAGPHRLPAYLPHRGLARAARREIDGVAGWLERLKSDPTVPTVRLSGWVGRLRTLWGQIPGDERPYDPKPAIGALTVLVSDVAMAQRDGLIDAPFADEIRVRLGYPRQLLEILQRDGAAQKQFYPVEAPPVPAATGPKAPGIDVDP